MVTILKGLAVLFGASIVGGVLGLIVYHFVATPENDPYGARDILCFMCGTVAGAICSLPFLARMALRAQMSRGNAPTKPCRFLDPVRAGLPHSLIRRNPLSRL